MRRRRPRSRSRSRLAADRGAAPARDLLARRTIERTGPPLARDPEGSRLDGAVATGSRTELTLESSVTYLLSLGLLDLASLVRHGLQIEEVPAGTGTSECSAARAKPSSSNNPPVVRSAPTGHSRLRPRCMSGLLLTPRPRTPPRIPAPTPLRSRALDPRARPRHRSGPPARDGGRSYTGLPRGLAPARGNHVGGMPRPARAARPWTWVGTARGGAVGVRPCPPAPAA